MSAKIAVIRRTTYDFSALAAGETQTFVLRRSIPASFSRGTLMVRVHDLDVDGSSDGEVSITVRADGVTPNDPAQFFFGQTLASVVAASNDLSAPRYVVDSFAVGSDHLMVQIEARQDSGSSLALSVRVSVELLLDDGPLAEEPWTPAALNADGWWRADLGHGVVGRHRVGVHRRVGESRAQA